MPAKLSDVARAVGASPSTVADILRGRPGYAPATPSEADTMTMAGMGLAAHRQAYNALYGDGHVKAYADPEERILWHSQGPNPASYSTHPCNLMVSNLYWGQFGPWATAGGASDENDSNSTWRFSSAKVWHDFDVAAGVDVF